MYPRAASGAVSGVAEDVNGLSDFESATAARCSVLGARQAHPSVARPPPPPLCSMFPNAVGKLSGKKLLGQEIWDAQDVSSLQLKRPVDRGYVVNWDLQKEIWGHGFKALLMDRDDVRGRISGIVVSEPVRDGFTVCIVRIVPIVLFVSFVSFVLFVLSRRVSHLPRSSAVLEPAVYAAGDEADAAGGYEVCVRAAAVSCDDGDVLSHTRAGCGGPAVYGDESIAGNGGRVGHHHRYWLFVRTRCALFRLSPD